VKRVNIESVTKHEEREYFKEYAEDYNTNTLPDEKFYDLDRWTKAETARRAAAAAAGETEAEERVTFDDEAERKAELARVRAERTAEYKRSAYERMKDSGDLENLREQERLKEQRKQAYNVGDAETVERINKILAPDEPGRR
jgi:multidrug efflux pump subunit AcrA (membrane-fusion protein)